LAIFKSNGIGLTVRSRTADAGGSPELATDDFDSASMVIHKHISPDANILIGLDEGNLDESIKVTLLTVH